MNSAGIPIPPPDDQEPPDRYDLARRVTVLETRFDTVIPTLATKTDLAELRTELLVKLEAMRAEMEHLGGTLYKWMAATLITIMLGFVGMFFGLTRTLTAVQVAAPAASNPVTESVAPSTSVRTMPSLEEHSRWARPIVQAASAGP